MESINIAYPDKDDILKNGCHSITGYKIKQEVINVNFAENAEKTPDMTEDEINSHIMEVVLVEYYNMKKTWNCLVSGVRKQSRRKSRRSMI